MFGTSNLVGVHYSEMGEETEDQMHTMWANFIKTGNPNNGEVLPIDVKWDKYEKECPKIYLFDKQMTCNIDKDQNLIDFFIKILYKK